MDFNDYVGNQLMNVLDQAGVLSWLQSQANQQHPRPDLQNVPPVQDPRVKQAFQRLVEQEPNALVWNDSVASELADLNNHDYSNTADYLQNLTSNLGYVNNYSFQDLFHGSWMNSQIVDQDVHNYHDQVIMKSTQNSKGQRILANDSMIAQEINHDWTSLQSVLGNYSPARINLMLHSDAPLQGFYDHNLNFDQFKMADQSHVTPVPEQFRQTWSVLFDPRGGVIAYNGPMVGSLMNESQINQQSLASRANNSQNANNSLSQTKAMIAQAIHSAAQSQNVDINSMNNPQNLANQINPSHVQSVDSHDIVDQSANAADNSNGQMPSSLPAIAARLNVPESQLREMLTNLQANHRDSNGYINEQVVVNMRDDNQAAIRQDLFKSNQQYSVYVGGGYLAPSFGFFPRVNYDESGLLDQPAYYVPEVGSNDQGQTRVMFNDPSYQEQLRNAENSKKNAKYVWRSAQTAANSPVTVSELAKALEPYFDTDNKLNSFVSAITNSASQGSRSLVKSFKPHFINYASGAEITSRENLPKEAQKLYDDLQKASPEELDTNPDTKAELQQFEQIMLSHGQPISFENGDINDYLYHQLDRNYAGHLNNGASSDLVLSHNGHMLSPSDVSNMEAVLRTATALGLDYDVMPTSNGIDLKVNDNRGMRITLMNLDNPADVGSVRDRSGAVYNIDYSRVNLLTSDEKDPNGRHALNHVGKTTPVFTPIMASNSSYRQLNNDGSRQASQLFKNGLTLVNRGATDSNRAIAQSDLHKVFVDHSMSIDQLGSNADQKKARAIQQQLAENHVDLNQVSDYDLANSLRSLSRDASRANFASLPANVKNYLAVQPMIQALGLDPKRSHYLQHLIDELNMSPDHPVTNYVSNRSLDNGAQRLISMHNINGQNMQNIKLSPVYDPTVGMMLADDGSHLLRKPLLALDSGRSNYAINLDNAMVMLGSGFNSNFDQTLSSDEAAHNLVSQYQDARKDYIRQMAKTKISGSDEQIAAQQKQANDLMLQIMSNNAYDLDWSDQDTQKAIANAHVALTKMIDQSTIEDSSKFNGPIEVDDYQKYVGNYLDSLSEQGFSDKQIRGIQAYADGIYKQMNQYFGTATLQVNDGLASDDPEKGTWYRGSNEKIQANENEHYYFDAVTHVMANRSANYQNYMFQQYANGRQATNEYQSVLAAHNPVASRMMQERMVKFNPAHSLNLLQLNQLGDQVPRYDEAEHAQDALLGQMNQWLLSQGQSFDVNHLQDQFNAFHQATSDQPIWQHLDVNAVNLNQWQADIVDGRLINEESSDEFKTRVINQVDDQLRASNLEPDLVGYNSQGQQVHYSVGDLFNEYLAQQMQQHRGVVIRKSGKNKGQPVVQADGSYKLIEPGKEGYVDFEQEFQDQLPQIMQQHGLVPDISIDDHGLVHYRAHQSLFDSTEHAFNHSLEGFRMAPVEGTIGQIFTPDRRGLVHTNFHTFNSEDDKDIQETYAISYRGVHEAPNPINERGDWNLDDLKNVNSRLILTGYDQTIQREIAQAIREQTAQKIGSEKPDYAAWDQFEQWANKNHNKPVKWSAQIPGHNQQNPIGQPANMDVLREQYQTYLQNPAVTGALSVDDFINTYGKQVNALGSINESQKTERVDFTQPEDTTVMNKLYHGENALTRVQDGQFDAAPDDPRGQELANKKLLWYEKRVRLANGEGMATSTNQIVREEKRIQALAKAWRNDHPHQSIPDPKQDPEGFTNFKLEMMNRLHSRLQALGGQNLGNLADPQNIGFFDPISTGQGSAQGLVRILTENAKVDATGHIHPATMPVPMSDEAKQNYQQRLRRGQAPEYPVVHFMVPNTDNTEMEDQMYEMRPYLDGAPLTKDQIFSQISELPFDRAFVAIEQAAKANYIDEHAKLALMNANLMNMEDGSVVSKHYAETHYQDRTDGTSTPLQPGDKLSDISGDKTTIARVIDPDMSLAQANQEGILDIVLFMKKSGADIIKSPGSQISRKNMSQVDEMIHRALNNGETVKIQLPKRYDHNILDENGQIIAHQGDLIPKLDAHNQIIPQAASADYQELGYHFEPTLTKMADHRLTAAQLDAQEQAWQDYQAWTKAGRPENWHDSHDHDWSTEREPVEVFEHNENGNLKPTPEYEMQDKLIDTNTSVAELTSFVTNIQADAKVNNYEDDDTGSGGRKYGDLIAKADAARGATNLTQYMLSRDSNSLSDFREYLRSAGYEMLPDSTIVAQGFRDQNGHIKQTEGLEHPGETRDHWTIDDFANRPFDQDLLNDYGARLNTIARTTDGAKVVRPVISPYRPGMTVAGTPLDTDHPVVQNADDLYFEDSSQIVNGKHPLYDYANNMEQSGIKFNSAAEASKLYVRFNTKGSNEVYDDNADLMHNIQRAGSSSKLSGVLALNTKLDQNGNLTNNQKLALTRLLSSAGLNDIEGPQTLMQKRIAGLSFSQTDRKSQIRGRSQNAVDLTVKPDQDFVNAIADSNGGDLEFPDGMTVSLPGNPEAHSISILPAALRRNLESEASGKATVNDYTQDYAQLASQLKRYQMVSNLMKQTYPDYDQSMFAGPNAAKEYQTYQTQRQQFLNAFNKYVWDHAGIQRTVDSISEKTASSVFGLTGNNQMIKRAFMREHIESNRIKAASTSVMTNGYDLPANVIEVSPEIAHNLGMVVDKNGNAYQKDDHGVVHHDWDMIHVHRDPVWRGHGSLGFKVRVNPSIVGARISPVVVSLMDGDYDGDTIGLISVKDEKAQQELHSMLNINNNMYDQAKAGQGYQVGSTDLNISAELVDLAARTGYNMDLTKSVSEHDIKQIVELNGHEYHKEDWQFGPLTTKDANGKQIVNQAAVKKLYHAGSLLYNTPENAKQFALNDQKLNKLNCKKILKKFTAVGLDIENRCALADKLALNGKVKTADGKKFLDPYDRVNHFVDSMREHIQVDHDDRLAMAGIDMHDEQSAKKSYQRWVDEGAKGGPSDIKEMFNTEYFHNVPLFDQKMMQYAKQMQLMRDSLQQQFKSQLRQGNLVNAGGKWVNPDTGEVSPINFDPQTKELTYDLSQTSPAFQKRWNETLHLLGDREQTKAAMEEYYHGADRTKQTEKGAIKYHINGVFDQLAILSEVMDANKEKSEETSQPGDMQKKLVNALSDQGPRGLALAEAFGYVMTQATLQVKHDPALAHKLADIELGPMKTVYNGHYYHDPAMYSLVGFKMQGPANHPTSVPLGKDIMIAGVNQSLIRDVYDAHQKQIKQQDKFGQKVPYTFQQMAKDNPQELHELRKQLIGFNDVKSNGEKLTDQELAQAFDKASRPMLAHWDEKTGASQDHYREVAKTDDKDLDKYKYISYNAAVSSLKEMFKQAEVDVPEGLNEMLDILSAQKQTEFEKDTGKAIDGNNKAMVGVAQTTKDKASVMTLANSQGDKYIQSLADKNARNLTYNHTVEKLMNNGTQVSQMSVKDFSANGLKVVVQGGSDLSQQLKKSGLTNQESIKRLAQVLNSFDDFAKNVPQDSQGFADNSRWQRVDQCIQQIDNAIQNDDLKLYTANHQVQDHPLNGLKHNDDFMKAWNEYKRSVHEFSDRLDQKQNKSNSITPDHFKQVYRDQVMRANGLADHKGRVTKQSVHDNLAKMSKVDQKHVCAKVNQQVNDYNKQVDQHFNDLSIKLPVEQKQNGNYAGKVFANIAYQDQNMTTAAYKLHRAQYIRQTEDARNFDQKLMQNLAEHHFTMPGMQVLSKEDQQDPVKQAKMAQKHLDRLIRMGTSKDPQMQETFKQVAHTFTQNGATFTRNGQTINRPGNGKPMRSDVLLRRLRDQQANLKIAESKLPHDPTQINKVATQKQGQVQVDQVKQQIQSQFMAEHDVQNTRQVQSQSTAAAAPTKQTQRQAQAQVPNVPQNSTAAPTHQFAQAKTAAADGPEM